MREPVIESEKVRVPCGCGCGELIEVVVQPRFVNGTHRQREFQRKKREGKAG